MTKWTRSQRRWLNRDVWRHLDEWGPYPSPAGVTRQECWRRTRDFLLHLYRSTGTWPDAEGFPR